MIKVLAIIGFSLIIACIVLQGCGNNGSEEDYGEEIVKIHDHLREKYLDLFYLPPEEAEERIEEDNRREQDEEEWKGLYEEYASRFSEMEAEFLRAVDKLMALSVPDRYRKYNEAYTEYVMLWAERESLQAQMYYLCIANEYRMDEIRASNNPEYIELEEEVYRIVQRTEDLLEGDLKGFFDEFALEQW